MNREIIKLEDDRALFQALVAPSKTLANPFGEPELPSVTVPTVCGAPQVVPFVIAKLDEEETYVAPDILFMVNRPSFCSYLNFTAPTLALPAENHVKVATPLLSVTPCPITEPLMSST